MDIYQIVDRSIKSGNSSLQRFTLELDDGTGLALEAVEKDGDPAISAVVMPAAELPQLSEAVCRVDWSWISGATIKRISIKDQIVALDLQPAGPLKIGVAVWQGSPFLSFHPFRPL